MIVNVAGAEQSDERTAKPSISDFVYGGESMSLAMASAKTRPRASANVTSSVDKSVVCPRTISSAVETSIIEVIHVGQVSNLTCSLRTGEKPVPQKTFVNTPPPCH